MAEPLSVTLTVITLATALKDVMEIAEKIRASFEKVSQNLRDAQRLVKDVKDTLDQLQRFCNQNYEVLNGCQEMKAELWRLAMKMNSVYSSCCSLIPPSDEKMTVHRRFKIAYHAWRKGDKIEKEIQGLKDDINRCHIRFTMFTVMGTRAELVELKQSNAKALDILDDISSMRVNEQRLCSFVGPNNALSILPASEMAEDAVADIYLQLQIDIISKLLLTRVSATQFAQDQSSALSYKARPFSISIDTHIAQDRKSLHSETVRLALQAQDLLKLKLAPTSKTLASGARILSHLAVRLNTLDMKEAALNMKQWDVKINQTLVSVDPMNYTLDLVFELGNLSRYYQDIGYLDAALASIADAVEVGRSFLAKSPTTMAPIVLSHVLSEKADLLNRNGHDMSLEFAQEAVKILENAFQFSESSEASCDIKYSFLEPLGNLLEASSCYHYVQALRQLSRSLRRKGQIEESFDTENKALEFLRLVNTPGNDCSVELEIAFILHELMHEDFNTCLPREASLLHAEECTEIYHKYANWHPKLYGDALCDAFSRKAVILGGLGRYQDALSAWKATLKLTKKFVRGQWQLSQVLDKMNHHLGDLGRHIDVIVTWVTAPVDTAISGDKFAAQAYGYGALAVWLHSTGRYREAIEAGQNAVSRYRALANDDPEEYTYDLASALSQLSQAFVSAELYDHAIDASREAFVVYDKLIWGNRTAVVPYQNCLFVGGWAARKSNNESKAISHHQDVVRRRQRLSDHYSEQVGYMTANEMVELHHNFTRFDRLSEARGVLAELLDTWEIRNGPLDNAEAVAAYLDASYWYIDALQNQGCTELALESLEKALIISNSYSAKDSRVSTSIAHLVRKRINLFCALGRYEEALEVGQGTMPSLEDSSNRNNKQLFFLNRIFTAHALQYHYDKTKEVIEMAEVALMLCQRPNFVEERGVTSRLCRYLSVSREYLAIGLANCGKKDDALKEARRAVDEAYNLKLEASEEHWKQNDEPSYMTTRTTLSACLIESGNLTEAIENLEEVQEYFEGRIKSRHSNYVYLASVLRVIGILYCAEGRHEEGTIAADCLSSLKTRLGIAIPSLIRQIELRAEHDMKRGGAANLRRLKADLTCHHQDRH